MVCQSRDRRNLKQGHPLEVGSCSLSEDFSKCDSAVKRLDLNAVEYMMLLTFA